MHSLRTDISLRGPVWFLPQSLLLAAEDDQVDRQREEDGFGEEYEGQRYVVDDVGDADVPLLVDDLGVDDEEGVVDDRFDAGVHEVYHRVDLDAPFLHVLDVDEREFGRNHASQHALYQLFGRNYLKILHCLVFLQTVEGLLQNHFALGLRWLQGDLDDADEVEQTREGEAEDPLPVFGVRVGSNVDQTDDGDVADDDLDGEEDGEQFHVDVCVDEAEGQVHDLVVIIDVGWVLALRGLEFLRLRRLVGLLGVFAQGGGGFGLFLLGSFKLALAAGGGVDLLEGGQLQIGRTI